MSERVALGKWRPDQPTLGAPGLYGAKNTLPRGIGYGPMPSLSRLASYGSLGARVRGAMHLTDYDGAVHNFAGDATNLEKIEAGSWADVSQAGNYTLGANSRWEFAAFTSQAVGRLPMVIATCYDEAVQEYTVGLSTLFADLSAAAPHARHCAVIGQQLHLGYTSDPVDGKVSNRAWWSVLGNAASWPTPGSDAAVSAQSDTNELFGDGGEITAIIGGSEYGVYFQERAVWRADYVGGDVMYAFRRMESQRGLMVPGLAVAFGRNILYFADDGWYVFDGVGSRAVGKDVCDDWFRRDFQFEFRSRVSTMVDPDAPIIHIGYTGVGHQNGVPNHVLHYNYLRDSFSWSEIEHDYLCSVVNPGPSMSMDRSPSPVPDELADSWDDVQTATRVAGAFDSGHYLATLSGSALAAEFETGDFELAPGRRSNLQSVRPIVTGGTATVAVAGTATRAEVPSFGSSVALDSTGKANMRKGARYHRLKLGVGSGWMGDAIAMDCEFSPAGLR